MYVCMYAVSTEPQFTLDTILLTSHRLTIIQRTKMIKTYYKNGDSAIATHCALRGDYGFHNRPTLQAIGKLMKRFEGTRVVTNIERTVHHRFAGYAKNIAIVSESVAEDPKVSNKSCGT